MCCIYSQSIETRNLFFKRDFILFDLLKKDWNAESRQRELFSVLGIFVFSGWVLLFVIKSILTKFKSENISNAF